MKKTLITGCNGFVGEWLIAVCTNNHMDVYGIDLQEQQKNNTITYFQADINDPDKINSIFEMVRPDAVFNLAGVSFLPDADASPKKALDANVSGTLSLLDAARKYAPSARVLLVGSSRQYDEATEDESIRETRPSTPVNFYGISKFISEVIGLQYHRQFNLDICCTRSFNHTGPGQSPRFVCSEWARQAALISLGKADPVISVGNMNVIIDFSDVRDVVEAYLSIMTKGRSGEVYNVCSGNGISLQWILDYLIRKSGRDISIHYSRPKFRINESVVKMVGDHSKLSNHTGWTPTINFQQTLDDLYDWWIKQLA